MTSAFSIAAAAAPDLRLNRVLPAAAYMCVCASDQIETV